jgi:hypothetical protein
MAGSTLKVSFDICTYCDMNFVRIQDHHLARASHHKDAKDAKSTKPPPGRNQRSNAEAQSTPRNAEGLSSAFLCVLGVSALKEGF